ncbi:unnamed protein product, partial [Meganyctiphanes norvegica]
NTSRLCSGVSRGNHLKVRSALRDGADPDTCMAWEFPKLWGGEFERIPVLTVAIANNNVDVVDILLDARVNTEFRGDFHIAPLSLAIAWKYTIIVEKLLNHGADISSRSLKHGWLPIHYAGKYGPPRIAEMLKGRRSPLDAVNDFGGTPLHLAARNGEIAMVEWLVKQGVEASTTDNKGNTAADYANSNGHFKLAEWLKEDACYANNKGRVLLFNYFEFNDPKNNRKGADKDSHAIYDTFGKFEGKYDTFGKFEGKYEVIIHNNLTTQTTLEKFKELKQDDSLNQLDSLIIIINSHGKSKHVFYTKDGEMNIKDLRSLFCETEKKGCPFLKGKPKIFMGSYCQGTAHEEDLSKSIKECTDFIETTATDASAITSKISVARNMKTIFSTSEGAVSWRNTRKGSCALQYFCKVLSKNPKLELHRLIFKINNEVEAELGFKNTFSEEGSRFNHFYF